MKQILCFGDSNTFGSNPSGGRHGRDIRWPGRLQALLGESFYVIEEGLGGRTTVWEDPLEPDRCGLSALPISLLSHRPLDLVILSLGTNDCKHHLHASPAAIARGMGRLCSVVKSYGYGEGYPVPQILVVSPIHIKEDICKDVMSSFDRESVEKSYQLGGLYERIARDYQALFLDAAKVAKPSAVDCLHMEAEEHGKMAAAVCEVIKRAF